jgi:hypothetical protein
VAGPGPVVTAAALQAHGVSRATLGVGDQRVDVSLEPPGTTEREGIRARVTRDGDVPVLVVATELLTREPLQLQLQARPSLGPPYRSLTVAPHDLTSPGATLVPIVRVAGSGAVPAWQPAHVY